jgi:hypothetical protein
MPSPSSADPGSLLSQEALLDVLRERVSAADRPVRMLLSGPPGAGKTHVLRQLAAEPLDGLPLVAAPPIEVEDAAESVLVALTDALAAAGASDGLESAISDPERPFGSKVEHLVSTLRSAADRRPVVLCDAPDRWGTTAAWGRASSLVVNRWSEERAQHVALALGG